MEKQKRFAAQAEVSLLTPLLLLNRGKGKLQLTRSRRCAV